MDARKYGLYSNILHPLSFVSLRCFMLFHIMTLMHAEMASSRPLSPFLVPSLWRTSRAPGARRVRGKALAAFVMLMFLCLILLLSIQLFYLYILCVIKSRSEDKARQGRQELCSTRLGFGARTDVMPSWWVACDISAHYVHE